MTLIVTMAVAAALGAGAASLDVPPPPGRWIDLGAHRLHLVCTGRGAPTVVIETGFDEFAADWVLVQRAAAGTARICAYDRAGYGFSDPGPLPRTFAQIGLELREALRRAGEKPPFVLVGHSYGGGVVRQYALDHPREVAGLVLVDVVSENQRIFMGDHTGYIADDARGRAIPPPREDAQGAAPSARLASPATGPLPPIDPPNDRLPADAQLWRRWALVQPAREEASGSEREWSAEYMARWRATSQEGTLGSLPLVVLTRREGGYADSPGASARVLEDERLRAQAALARLSTAGRHVLVPSGHDMQVEAPAVVADAIRDVVALARRSHSR